MRLPFFGKKHNPHVVPLPETLDCGYNVMFRVDGPPPSVEDLQPIIEKWLDTHADEAMRSDCKEWMDQGSLLLQVGTRQELNLPSREILQAFGMGETEERRLAEFTHAVNVVSSGSMQHAGIALWCTIAAARALAQAFEGVILDFEIGRLLDVDSHGERIPAEAVFHVQEHILIPSSVNKRGVAWMTTLGMGRFGLPNLQITEAPPDLVDLLSTVINTVAHELVITVMKLNSDSEETQTGFSIADGMRVSQKSVALALDMEPEEPEAGVRGWTMIGLEYQPKKRNQEAFINLVAPEGFRSDKGVWLHSLLTDLFGTEDTLRHVDHDSGAMQEAHERAVAELPAVKQRFQDGLETGETLFVKYGFDVPGEDFHEFMWLTVNTWQGDHLQAQLANDPDYRRDLQAGQTIELRDEDVYDWLLTGPNDEAEGGYTADVVREEGIQPE